VRSAAFLLDASVDGLPEMERTTFPNQSASYYEKY